MKKEDLGSETGDKMSYAGGGGEIKVDARSGSGENGLTEAESEFSV